MIWRLSGKALESINNSEVRMRVRVLGEELAYNRSLRQFKMFILEQPLDPNYKVGVGVFGVWILQQGWEDSEMVYRFKTTLVVEHTPYLSSFQE